MMSYNTDLLSHQNVMLRSFHDKGIQVNDNTFIIRFQFIAFIELAKFNKTITDNYKKVPNQKIVMIIYIVSIGIVSASFGFNFSVLGPRSRIVFPLSYKRMTFFNIIKNLVAQIQQKNMSILKNSKIAQSMAVRQQDYQTQALKESVLSKFLEFTHHNRNNNLREGIKNVYGRNYPINYHESYNFSEQWQSTKKFFEQSNFYELIQNQNWANYLYTLCLLLGNVALLWYVTIYRLLELILTQQCQFILSLGIGMTLIDCSVKLCLRYRKSTNTLEWKDILLIFKEQIFLICYLFVNLGVSLSIGNSSLSFFMYIFDLMAIACLFRRAGALFTHFRIRSYMTAYKRHFKLIDLLTNMFIAEYVFTILIYLISFQNPNNNWLIHFGRSGCTDFERLFYSFYFVNTTMLTIGYGDIAPVNNAQIACVVVIQIFGVVVFSYVISEIGYTLSTIRKEEEHLEHNISTLAKMSKHYGLEEELTNHAKSYLINNQKSQEDIYPQEEKTMLIKLNDDLRQAIAQESSLSIVKSSLFFISYWSKRCQLEIAKHLTKKILNPNELIIQTPGKERIYIIKSGKLQVYTNNYFGFKQHFKKLLKTIQPNPKNQVSDNIYGYTQVFTSRIVKLSAISKSFSSVYFLEKQHFLECVNDHKLDHQYYFQIKAKIEESPISEAWQAPNILNIRQHFRPNAIYIIKQHVSQSKRFRNSRKDYIRKNRCQVMRNAKIYQNLKTEDFGRMSSAIDEILMNQLKTLTLLNERSNPNEEKMFTKEQILLQQFQIPREYHNFFSKHNLQTVLTKLQMQNYICPKYRKSEEQNKHTKNRMQKRQSNFGFVASFAVPTVYNFRSQK